MLPLDHALAARFGSARVPKDSICVLLGIVTRRPLVLQLHKTDGGHEYAEFLHAPRKRFTDFGKTIVLHLFISAICFLSSRLSDRVAY